MDFPIENGGSFHSYVTNYQRVSQTSTGSHQFAEAISGVFRAGPSAGPSAGLREFYQAHHKDETKESAALRSKMDAAKVTFLGQVLSENGGITP